MGTGDQSISADLPTSRAPDRELRSSSSCESVNGDPSEERRRHFIRSRTNPDFMEVPLQRSDRVRMTEGQRTRTDSTGSQEEARSPTRADQRKNRYRRKAERAHSGHILAGPNDDLDPYVGLDRQVAEAAHRYEASVQGNGPESPTAPAGGAKVFRVFTQPKIEYLSKGRCLAKFGAKGNGEGQFNWPRGIALVPSTDEIAGKTSELDGD